MAAAKKRQEFKKRVTYKKSLREREKEEREREIVDDILFMYVFSDYLGLCFLFFINI